jgi:DNA-binding NarL/FixJ family response regulator
MNMRFQLDQSTTADITITGPGDVTPKHIRTLQSYLNLTKAALSFEVAEETSVTTSALSPQETKIMTLLAEGKLYNEIGQRLNLSPQTVKNHMAQIFLKLKVRNRTEAVLAWQRYKEGKHGPARQKVYSSVETGSS